MNVPDSLLYTKDHEWALSQNGVITVGITDFAQHQLGDIVYLELPSLGTQITKGNTFGVVESVKAVSDLYAPISGEVVEVNENLKNAPETVNKDPYHAAWMIKVRVTQPNELKELLTHEQYKKLTS
ncbi:MAG: glycine cleavage system protein GcvH [Deltaproteobacteria bacterium]|nr:glycine cleavage system protein GcvH [Deltaproteobacteria bacterium]